jgi:hypothetical protein
LKPNKKNKKAWSSHMEPSIYPKPRKWLKSGNIARQPKSQCSSIV